MKIRPELQNDYNRYVEINADAYSKAVVCAGERLGRMLDEGKNPAEVIKSLSWKGLDSLTVYMAGAAVRTVCHFNPRGDELRIEWNKQYDTDEYGKSAVSSARFTITD